jgi:hypothetical protein
VVRHLEAVVDRPEPAVAADRLAAVVVDRLVAVAVGLHIAEGGCSDLQDAGALHENRAGICCPMKSVAA